MYYSTNSYNIGIVHSGIVHSGIVHSGFQTKLDHNSWIIVEYLFTGT